MKTVTFFSNKEGVGTTSLVYITWPGCIPNSA